MVSLMGFLMLSGIVVNNGIILIDMAIQNQNEGMDTVEALVDSGKGRLRPILMTTLTTILKYRYKMTFKEYLVHCRIEKAKAYMLSHPDEVMETVADECGFGCSSNFSHKFKDEVGESPKAWLHARLAERRSNNEDKPCETN